MSHFQPVDVTLEGQRYVITAAEMEPLASYGGYWHSAGDPSTWLTESTFGFVRGKFPDAPQHIRLELTGLCLGINGDKVRSNIEWHENYMRWHDGDDSYRVLD